MTEQETISTESNGQNNENNENDSDNSDRDRAIIRQVEYYFGDANLLRDKFLSEQVKLDDGWVPLDVLIRFNRLAKITTDTAIIANALKKSTSDLLEISNDDKKIRRNPELQFPEMNEETRKEILTRTAYVNGFPKDSTLDDLLKFFKDFEEVENVIMRKYQDRQKKRHFKGSVFATFKTKEQTEKFVNLKGLKYGDTNLVILWQGDYIKQKHEELANKRHPKQNKSQSKDKKEDKPKITLPMGTILSFSHANGVELTRENIKSALKDVGSTEVAYIEYNRGANEGWVRLGAENAAKEAFEKITDGKLKIGETEVTFKLLEGDEEKTYLEKTVEEMMKKRKNGKQFKNKGKMFKGKQGRKRKMEKDDDAPAAKVKATS